MKRIAITLTAIVALCFVGSTAKADRKVSLSLYKGATVILKIPLQAMKYEKNAVSGASIFGANIRVENGKPVVNSMGSWEAEGLPLMAEFQFEKYKAEKEFTELEFRNSAVYVKLRFEPSITDIDSALAPMIYKGSLSNYVGSDEYLNNIFPQQCKIAFRDALETLKDSDKLELLKKANFDANAFGAATYKEKNYFVRNFKSENIYNTIQLNQSQRIARAINDEYLADMKIIHPYIEHNLMISGIKISSKIAYKNFVSGSESGVDDVEIYTPKELIKKFKDADITSQEMIDGSVILVNGNRIKIALSGTQ